MGICRNPTSEIAADSIARFLLLLLGCAVQCDNRDSYIEGIQSMESVYQKGMMAAIKKILGEQVQTTWSDSELANPEVLVTRCDRAFQCLNEAVADRDRYAQTIVELQHKIATDQISLESAAAAAAAAATAADQAAAEDPSGNRRASNGIQLLRQQVGSLSDEVDAKNNAIQELLALNETNKLDMLKQQSRFRELEEAAEDNSALRDEIEEWRSKLAKASKENVARGLHEASLSDNNSLKSINSELQLQIDLLEQKTARMTDQARSTVEAETQLSLKETEVKALHMELDLTNVACDRGAAKIAELKAAMALVKLERDELTTALEESCIATALAAAPTAVGFDLEQEQLAEKTRRLQEQERSAQSAQEELNRQLAINADIIKAHETTSQGNAVLASQVKDLEAQLVEATATDAAHETTSIDNAALVRQVKDLEAQLAEATAAAVDQRARDAPATLAAQSALAVLRQEHTALCQVHAGLQQSMHDLEKSGAAEEERLCSLEAAKAEHGVEIERVWQVGQDQIAVLREKVVDIEGQRFLLEAQIQYSKGQVLSLKDALAERTEAFKGLQTKDESLVLRCAGLEVEMRRLAKENERSAATATSFAEKAKLLEDQIAALTEQLAEAPTVPVTSSAECQTESSPAERPVTLSTGIQALVGPDPAEQQRKAAATLMLLQQQYDDLCKDHETTARKLKAARFELQQERSRSAISIESKPRTQAVPQWKDLNILATTSRDPAKKGRWKGMLKGRAGGLIRKIKPTNSGAGRTEGLTEVLRSATPDFTEVLRSATPDFAESTIKPTAEVGRDDTLWSPGPDRIGLNQMIREGKFATMARSPMTLGSKQTAEPQQPGQQFTSPSLAEIRKANALQFLLKSPKLENGQLKKENLHPGSPLVRSANPRNPSPFSKNPVSSLGGGLAGRDSGKRHALATVNGPQNDKASPHKHKITASSGRAPQGGSAGTVDFFQKMKDGQKKSNFDDIFGYLDEALARTNGALDRKPSTGSGYGGGVGYAV